MGFFFPGGLATKHAVGPVNGSDQARRAAASPQCSAANEAGAVWLVVGVLIGGVAPGGGRNMR